MPRGIRLSLAALDDSLRQLRSAHLAYGGKRPRHRLAVDHGGIGECVEQRNALCLFLRVSRDYGSSVAALLRELRLDIEGAYGVYLVVEKVDAVGQLVGV